MPRLRLFLIAFILSVAILAPCLLARDSFAQDASANTPIVPVSLPKLTEEVNVGPQSIFVIQDQNRRYGFGSIIALIQTGDIAKSATGSSSINLGSKGTPVWVVIPVQNASDQDMWNLDFGNSQNGRTGFVQKAILYEATSKQTFFNTTTANGSSAFNGTRMESSVPLLLKRNTTSYLIFYLEGIKGSLSSFKPSFHSSFHSDVSIFNPQARLFFLAAIIILLTGFFFSRNVSCLTLSLMWLLLFLYRGVVDDFLLIDTHFIQLAAPTLRLIVPLLFFASLWLTPDIRERYPRALFLGTGLIFIICGVTGVVLPSIAPLVGILLSYTPMIGISIISLLMIWPVVRSQPRNNGNGLALIAIGFLITSLWNTYASINDASSLELLLIINPWIVPTFAVLSALLQIHFSEQKFAISIPSLRNDFDSSADVIREAREASEHTRLLQVLDQERATMKEMQQQEARQTEEMKRAKESADEANIAKSAFLAVVSHEIRTPMTGIMGMVRLILDTGLSREQKEYAHTIQDSGEALLSLLNDILDFEKIESGKLELEKTSFDLKRLLKGVHTLMNGHAASKNVELVLDVDETIPNYVIGDPTRMRQVLLNLVNNAIKFTARGAVTMHVKNLSDIETGKNATKQIYFGVQDSGIGISPEAQKKIFTPFAQADASITRKFGGTGLGLTICKRLIDAMGSSIGINSREGEGSTFFFTLQMQTATSADDMNTKSASFLEQSSKKLRVLVVDDNGINQKVIQSLLTRNGHQSIVASNADDAVNEVKQSPFDLVLMDIELPGKSGLDATLEIRSLPEKAQADIPIVAMTGNVGSEDIKKYLNNGMNDFIGKPVMPENLQKILYKAGQGDYAAVPLIQSVAQLISPELVPHIEDYTTINSEEEDLFASAVKEFEDKEVNPAPEKFLDESLVASLINSLGIDQTKNLMVDFYAKTEELIRDIHDAGASSNAEDLHARAHELKGMAANFGFSKLASVVGKIEKDSDSAPQASLMPLIEMLDGIYRSSLTEMEERLKS